MIRRPPRSTLFPYNDALPIFGVRACGGLRADDAAGAAAIVDHHLLAHLLRELQRDHAPEEDRKSTRLNSSHSQISYAVFCLKKKKKKKTKESKQKKQLQTSIT